MEKTNEIVLFETQDKEIKLSVPVDQETVWLNRNQMAELFERDVKTIGKHINNALKEELDDSTIAKFATVQNEGTTMLVNSEFVALLKQANTDSSKMAEVIGVSDAQLRFVTNSQSGMGLLKCGTVVIPFDNQIGKDTSLYKLYNANIHEKIAK